MKKQTAVEWLALYIKGITSLNCDEVIEQAKDMEKEQIIDAVKYGNSFEQGDLRCEIYYKETFKSE